MRTASPKPLMCIIRVKCLSYLPVQSDGSEFEVDPYAPHVVNIVTSKYALDRRNVSSLSSPIDKYL